MASHFGAAVIGELAGRAVSKVLATLGDRSGVDEKLRRLKMLVIKLRSTVKVSEKLGTETASLLEWRDKLKEAAEEGQQVLLSFQKRASPEANAATEAAKGHHHGGSTSGAMSVTRTALQGVARSVRNATALLLPGCEESEAGEERGVREHGYRRQAAGTDILGEYYLCFDYAESSDDCMYEEPDTTSTTMEVPNKDALAKERARSTAVEGLEDALATEEDGLAEEPAMTAALKRLNDVVVDISRAVEMADGRDLSDLECLTESADVLREEKQRGHAILQIVRDTKVSNQAEEGHGEDLLYSAKESLENLALDVGWFTSLVSLCTPIK
ncbi:hypothetical protein QOZ80_3AG0210410 [Eleusine coracana subsp. coracana]|nr:hypothetical protein QOZ80_3AG0210410 [Eleusine coracana subsp. coracana]